MQALRIDKWLWAARFYKTRSLAADEIGKGRVQLNGQDAKAAREVKVGDRVRLRQGQVLREVWVRGISAARGPAPVAQQLYEETPESITAREAAAQQRRLAAEPAMSIEQGRPTKRERRQMDKAWDARWSAGLD
ncbi:MAG: RNA-binding S4 domain-containing protein [Betaproteobacteria bacterium]|nr:RNA-binding S4 domain-containing protein [Betaproteobacteria bacterium]